MMQTVFPPFSASVARSHVNSVQTGLEERISVCCTTGYSCLVRVVYVQRVLL